MDFSNITIRELNKKIKAKEVSVSELVDFHIKQTEKKDKDIKAFVSYFFDEARAEARKLDELVLSGDDIGLLFGIPSSIKDNILIEGFKSTSSSKILENYIAPYDAFVIEKLKDEKSIFLGKANMDEFAMGASTENSYFFKTKNPYDLERVPGGSSGGSTASVASGEVLFSLGSETGGSIRQPASFCGVVGLKPTYGSVSRYGVMAMTSSVDQIAPTAKKVDDVRIVFEAIRGKDKKDATSVFYPEKQQEKRLKDMVVGVPREFFNVEGINNKVKALIEESIKKIEKTGAKIEEISLPHIKYALAVYYIIVPAEVSSNMARYDGIKYGYSTMNKDKDLLDVYQNSREIGFGDEVKKRIMLGTYVLSAGYYDAYYKKAQLVRTKIVDDFKNAFKKVDIIATPTTPDIAFKFGEKSNDPLAMYLEDIFTAPVNLAGVPAISVPCGKVDDMPVGLQFIAPWFYEETLFKAGEDFEIL